MVPHDDAAQDDGAAIPTCSTAAPTPRTEGAGSETAAEAAAGAIIFSPGPVAGDALAMVSSAASGSAPVRQECTDPQIVEMQPHLVTETDTHKVCHDVICSYCAHLVTEVVLVGLHMRQSQGQRHPDASRP